MIELKPMIRSMKRAISGMLVKAVAKTVDDSTMMQEVQVTVLHGEVDGPLERYQDFGFTSVPPEGSEAILAAIGGDQSHRVVLKMDSRDHRPTGLNDGDSCLYDAHSPQHTFKLVAGGAELDADLDVDGDVTASGDYKQGAFTGVTGTITMTQLPPGPGAMVIVIKGGIVTSVTPTAPWTFV